MEAFHDIADRARLLAKIYPENAERLILARRELEQGGFAAIRADLESRELLGTINAWLEQCRDSAARMNELAVLACQYLPDFRCEWVRVNPRWRFDDPATDWPAIVAELDRIEDAAIRAAGQAVEQPSPTESVLERYNQGTKSQRAAALFVEAQQSGNNTTLRAFVDGFNRGKRERVKLGTVKNAVSDLRRILKIEGSKQGSNAR